jgi:hypothetical protein
MWRIALTLILAPALLATACTGGESKRVSGDSCKERVEASKFTDPVPEDAEAYGLVVNSDLSVGPNRVLVGVLDGTDAPIGSPDMTVSMDFFDICRTSSEPDASADAEFIWTIEPIQGVFVGNAEFERDGTYGAEITIKGEGVDETAFTSFEVKPEPSTPAIGAPAPTSPSKTSADVKDLSRLTTDPKPDPSFYELSIAQAIAAKKPFVLVFSTPQFCTSAVCGPTLDIVKSVKPDHRGVNFVHVEVYELPADVNNLKTVAAVNEWGLPSEPWVFVVDADGNVAAKFEGGVGAEELDASLKQL